jgi:phytoene dehydrogenase-like protein
MTTDTSFQLINNTPIAAGNVQETHQEVRAFPARSRFAYQPGGRRTAPIDNHYLAGPWTFQGVGAVICAGVRFGDSRHDPRE